MTAARTIRRRARGRGGQRGFTLVELLIGMILASIFATALFAFFFSGVDAVRTHESQARAQADSRTAINRLASEARQAISPDDGLTPPIAALGPTELVMYVDPSRTAGTVALKPHRVRYAVESGRLIRESAAPIGATAPFTYGGYTGRTVLLDPLRNGAQAAFTAVSTGGDALPATPSASQRREIGRISVHLVVGQRTGASNTTLELNTDVALRNALRT